jgi:hypothetical protein
VADIVDKGREGGNGVREGQREVGNRGQGRGKLTMISPSAASLVVCTIDKALMSGFAVVVVLAKHGGAPGT